MKEFRYVIKDEVGIHARPAGILVKEAKSYASTLTIEVNGKKAELAGLMSVMGLGAKQGMELVIRAEGADEKEAIEGIKKIIEKNL